MRYALTGQTGGIGTAIHTSLKEHLLVYETEEMEWLIFAHGVIDESDVGRTFAVNTLTCLSKTQDYLPRIKQGVIYISSTAGITGNSMFPVYAASKAALNIYAKSMAKKHPELQFYSICPGPTDTKMWRSLNLDGKAQAPLEVAKAVKNCMDGLYESGSIITVRDGEIVCK